MDEPGWFSIVGQALAEHAAPGGSVHGHRGRYAVRSLGEAKRNPGHPSVKQAVVPARRKSRVWELTRKALDASLAQGAIPGCAALHPGYACWTLPDGRIGKEGPPGMVQTAGGRRFQGGQAQCPAGDCAGVSAKEGGASTFVAGTRRVDCAQTRWMHFGMARMQCPCGIAPSSCLTCDSREGGRKERRAVAARPQ